MSFDLFMDSCSMNVGVNKKYLDKFYENGYDDIRMMEFIDEYVLISEIGFKNKLLMNLMLKKVEWLKESQNEFKYIILDKLKLPKRYILIFNEKGIVNMEYLVRFNIDRELLKNHFGIKVEKHLNALCNELKQYQNGIHYKISIDSINCTTTPITPSVMQKEGKNRTKNNGDLDQPIPGKDSIDIFDITPGDVVQTAGYGPNKASDQHLRNLCGLNVVTKVE